MPWDGTALWVGALDERGTAVRQSRRVAGGASESIYQPAWSPDGVLYFISDRSNWWNLYRLRGDDVEAVCPQEAEFGRPLWVFGSSTYAFIDARTILCTYAEQGMNYLANWILIAGSWKISTCRLPVSTRSR